MVQAASINVKYENNNEATGPPHSQTMHALILAQALEGRLPHAASLRHHVQPVVRQPLVAAPARHGVERLLEPRRLAVLALRAVLAQKVVHVAAVAQVQPVAEVALLVALRVAQILPLAASRQILVRVDIHRNLEVGLEQPAPAASWRGRAAR